MIGWTVRAARCLVLPVAVPLFAQWLLREALRMSGAVAMLAARLPAFVVVLLGQSAAFGRTVLRASADAQTATVRRLLRYLGAQAAVLALTLAWPGFVHLGVGSARPAPTQGGARLEDALPLPKMPG